MNDEIRIQRALISVYHKEGLAAIVKVLQQLSIEIYSSGGTAQYIQAQGAEVVDIATLTGYPSILGGRVKTLHPKVHGGILARRNSSADQDELSHYEIPFFDLVVVDLYPFEETLAKTDEESVIIEKIDIGGIALMRAAAKNFQDVLIIPSHTYYTDLLELLTSHGGTSSLFLRKKWAAQAFSISSHYDTHIFEYLSSEENKSEQLKISYREGKELRYGENPHQQGYFWGSLSDILQQLHGKALSYNNLVDLDAALRLVSEFDKPFFAVIKHTNPCGCAIGKNLLDAWHKALAGDPISAFGGVLACNGTVDEAIAKAVDELFFEILAARDFTEEALAILTKKKNRILLRWSGEMPNHVQVKSVLNGFLSQSPDLSSLTSEMIDIQTDRRPTEEEQKDILFGDTVCKHLKSNAIAIVKNLQLIGSGIGQTSRVDAVHQAIGKAKAMGFELEGGVLASDAFFPFADSVKLAKENGIEVIVEPGGSKRDSETIDFCRSNNMCLIFTKTRHFKH